MDEENLFSTQDERDKMRKSLQQCIREEVECQDAAIGQDVLDLMVNIQVWGRDKYELADFTDDELAPAVTTIAMRQGQSAECHDGQERLRQALRAARAAHQDIKVPLLRLCPEKAELAHALWPVLLAKCEAELAADAPTTPVLKVVLEARDLAARFTGVFSLERPEEKGSAHGDLEQQSVSAH
ncbi:hypothetical protein [Streptomyces rishiriensis]|uniref:hypothetical protein n=1 Tax=Streptomyces rishiriensis TaxID=68264 RepID=UPI0037D798FC